MTEVITNDPMGIQDAFQVASDAVKKAQADSKVTQAGVDAPESAPIQ